MKLEDIFKEWEKDSYIDKTELGDEALKIPKLHHKYFNILSIERLLLKQYEINYKKLYLEKYEFYSQGHTEETRKKGWELPAKGLLLKTEYPFYLEADKDLNDLNIKINIQKEKVTYLDSVIKSIMNRSFIIRDCIDWTKFTMGA